MLLSRDPSISLKSRSVLLLLKTGPARFFRRLDCCLESTYGLQVKSFYLGELFLVQHPYVPAASPAVHHLHRCLEAGASISNDLDASDEDPSAAAAILLMVGQEATLGEIVPAFVAGRMRPPRIGCRATSPGQVNDGQRHGRVGRGEKHVVAVNTPSDSHDREAVQNMLWGQFFLEFTNEGFLRTFKPLPRLQPFELRRGFGRHGSPLLPVFPNPMVGHRVVEV